MVKNYVKNQNKNLKTDCFKKQAFFEENLSETIGKPKELWESLKFLGMPNKTVISNFNVIEKNDTLTHDTWHISNTCKVAKLKPIYEKGKKTDPSN